MPLLLVVGCCYLTAEDAEDTERREKRMMSKIVSSHSLYIYIPHSVSAECGLRSLGFMPQVNLR